MPIYPSSTTTVDGTTITENSSGEIEVKQSTITQNGSLADITYSSDTTLTADVYANNVTIDSGITVTTNGYNFYCQGDFTNNGNVDTGTDSASGNIGGYGGGELGYGLYIQANTITAGTINSAGKEGITGNNNTQSAGGGGGGSLLFAYGSGGYTAGTYTTTGGAGQPGYNGTTGDGSGGAGGSTLVSGGAGGASGVSGGAGASNSAPTLTSADINSFYSNGMLNYLAGGGGGGGGGVSGTANSGTSFTSSYGGSGGGGGGVATTSGNGGAGGAGIVITFSGEPVSIPGFSYSTNTDSIRNRNSTYQYYIINTTSTSATSVISQSLTPKTTGLIAVRVLAKIYNNTVGDGVDIYLYNGTTEIDSDSYTQEGLASNPHLTALYYEAQYTTGTQQTFSVQFNAVTGGTAYCEIQEFTIEEIY